MGSPETARMRNVRARIAYDGSGYFGWQRQEGFESVQGVLEDALEDLLGSPVRLHGAGRTDTGVHGLGQVCHVHVATRLEDDALRHAWNAHLPDDVVVTRLETCADDFHARFHARGKRYAYWTLTSRFRPPFQRGYAHWSREPLDLGSMRAAARHLVGRHDFAALASSGSPRKTTVRTIRSLHILPRRSAFGIVVEGDGFLYNMVRTLAGTLLDVGRQRRDPGEIPGILESKDRSRAGPTAPAEGLYLVSVLYAPRAFAGRDRGPRGAAGLFP